MDGPLTAVSYSIRAFLILFVVAISAMSVQAQERVLSFGLVPTESHRTLKEIWQPFLDDMSETIQVPIKCKTYDDYAGVIWAMGAGNVQIAWMGNKSAIEAVDRAGGEIAFKTVDTDGAEGYWAHLITGANSGFAGERDVFVRAGEITFGNGDPNSTSGYVVPGYYLFARNGVEPRAIFKRVTQANHQENLFAVAEGRVDVATSNNIALKRFKALYPAKFHSIRVIWTSPLIPSDPIVWRKSLPHELKARISAFILDYGRASPGKSTARLDHERSVLSDMTYSGFVGSSDLQLIPVRRLELFQLRCRIEADPSLDTQQRALKVKELDDEIQLISSEQKDESR